MMGGPEDKKIENPWVLKEFADSFVRRLSTVSYRAVSITFKK
jgi:hypothetical protein